MGKFRVAQAGTGTFGKNHARVCAQELNDIEIVAICNRRKRNKDELKDMGLSPNIPQYIMPSGKKDDKEYVEHFKFMINEQKPDAVILVVPPELNRRFGEIALNANCHVFVDKPMAMTVEDCLKLKKIANKRGRTLMVGHLLRFMPMMNDMRKDRDFFSKVKEVEVTARSFRPTRVGSDETRSGEAGMGVVLDLGVHYVDLVKYVLGGLYIEGTIEAKKHIRGGHENKADISILTENNVKAIFHLEWMEKDSGKEPLFNMIFRTDEGKLEIDLRKVEVKWNDKITKKYSTERLNYIKEELDYFFKICEGKERNKILPLRDAIYIVNLCNKIVEKAETA